MQIRKLVNLHEQYNTNQENENNSFYLHFNRRHTIRINTKHIHEREISVK